MDNEQTSNACHGGRTERGTEGAEVHIGPQHGSAAGSDLPAESMPSTARVDLAAPPLVNLGAVTAAAVRFGTSPSTRFQA